MKNCYISGKITGLPRDEVHANFERGADVVRLLGYNAINPITKISSLLDDDWKGHMLEDIALLFDCDSIYLLDNWIFSDGARIEFAIAGVLKKEILYETMTKINAKF